jgi:hypothetical protein
MRLNALDLILQELERQRDRTGRDKKQARYKVEEGPMNISENLPKSSPPSEEDGLIMKKYALFCY